MRLFHSARQCNLCQRDKNADCEVHCWRRKDGVPVCRRGLLSLDDLAWPIRNWL